MTSEPGGKRDDDLCYKVGILRKLLPAISLEEDREPQDSATPAKAAGQKIKGSLRVRYSWLCWHAIRRENSGENWLVGKQEVQKCGSVKGWNVPLRLEHKE